MYQIGEQVYVRSDDNINYFPGTIEDRERDYSIILCCIPYYIYYYRIRLTNGEMVYNVTSKLIK